MKLEIAKEDLGTELFESTRARYLDTLQPLFFPADPTGHDIIRYFSSILRLAGMEDRGWDPYQESGAVLEDLHALGKIEYSSDQLNDRDKTKWRLGLLFYQHAIEMNAPYEVITNLLRFHLDEGYSPNPYYKFLNSKQRKKIKNSGLYPRDKIQVIKKLDERANLGVYDLLSEFVNLELRNTIGHSDFIIHDETFRSRKGYWTDSFEVSLIELDKILTSVKAFVSAFIILDKEAKRYWGQYRGRAIPYDPQYKGIMEVLADKDGMMNGFCVHWPNNAESKYRRTEKGVEAINCSFSPQTENIDLFVGMYARVPGSFSPLVETDKEPQYTSLEGADELPKWDLKAAAAPSGFHSPDG